MNAKGITTVTATSEKSILFMAQPYVGISIQVANTGVVAVNGKKIIKAGTPLKGDLTARGTAFTVAADGEKAIGVLYKEADVTAGTINATLVVFGYLRKSSLDGAVVTALGQQAENLAAKITLVD